ncbi:CCN family member 2b isoform X2 [Plectropomus leopardus]|uniref:CCN family member 2b isoform X2 n=1 Tax=Plectropomus leopardus TaxID=160734 RepID=UPI001C4AA439|nr:CCN family member 2b isoform X2 [Plectropomus leopardus]
MSVETSAALSVFLLIISATVAQDCSQPCACSAPPPPCPLGTSLVLDGCGCCKVCARQLGEPCSLLEPCDHHKELYCDYTLLSDTETGICMAQEGQMCDLGGVMYRSGESFQPSCKHHCVCMNGEIGCVPMCASDVRLPSPDCPYPSRIHIPGKCCEEWEPLRFSPFPPQALSQSSDRCLQQRVPEITVWSRPQSGVSARPPVVWLSHLASPTTTSTASWRGRPGCAWFDPATTSRKHSSRVVRNVSGHQRSSRGCASSCRAAPAPGCTNQSSAASAQTIAAARRTPPSQLRWSSSVQRERSS